MKRFGFIKVSYEGLNFAKTLNALNAHGIFVRKIKKQAQKISFEADISEKEEILAILNLSVYNNLNIEECDIASFFKKRWATLVGVAVFLIFSLLPQFFFIGFSIDCKDEKILAEVQNLLPTYGAKVMSPIGGCDVFGLKNSILDIKNVSFSEVVIKNGKGYISVQTELKPNKQTPKFEIKAVRPAVVTKILTLSGTPLVAIGDKVEAGQKLIGGFVTSQKTGKTQEVKACGEVYGRVEIVQTRKVYKSVATFQETGKEQITRRFTLFGLKIFSKPCDFSYSNVQTTTQKFIGVLPIEITQELHKQTTFEVVDVDVEKETMAQSIDLKKEAENLRSMGEIVDSYLTITDFSEYLSLNLHTIIEMKISEE